VGGNVDGGNVFVCEGINCPKVEEILNVNNIPSISNEAVITATRFTDRILRLYYISNASQKQLRK
jgi:predicted transcriptional regulator